MDLKLGLSVVLGMEPRASHTPGVCSASGAVTLDLGVPRLAGRSVSQFTHTYVKPLSQSMDMSSLKLWGCEGHCQVFPPSPRCRVNRTKGLNGKICEELLQPA